MASGFAKDPVYGLPRTGSTVHTALSTPRTQTVLNMNKKRAETITIESGDDHYVQDGPSAGDLYHE